MADAPTTDPRKVWLFGDFTAQQLREMADAMDQADEETLRDTQ